MNISKRKISMKAGITKLEHNLCRAEEKKELDRTDFQETAGGVNARVGLLRALPDAG